MKKKEFRVKPKRLQVQKQKSLYDKDYFGWVHAQAHLLKKKDYNHIDFDNLIEEIISLGNSEYDKLESHLRVLLMHMLKAKYQPTMHTHSWDLSIKNARYQALRVLKKNPSLKSKINEIFKDAYYSARLEAAIETRLNEKVFPKECPWELKEIL